VKDYIKNKMKFGNIIIQVLRRAYSPHEKLALGRWNIENCSELKIKYANEDNCGISCSNNAAINIQKQTKHRDEFNDD
jgi:hypothetical protein